MVAAVRAAAPRGLLRLRRSFRRRGRLLRHQENCGEHERADGRRGGGRSSYRRREDPFPDDPCRAGVASSKRAVRNSSRRRALGGAARAPEYGPPRPGPALPALGRQVDPRAYLKTEAWLKRPVEVFHVPPKMTKFEIKEYLTKLYGLQVSKVHTAIYNGRRKLDQATGRKGRRPTTRRRTSTSPASRASRARGTTASRRRCSRRRRRRGPRSRRGRWPSTTSAAPARAGEGGRGTRGAAAAAGEEGQELSAK